MQQTQQRPHYHTILFTKNNKYYYQWEYKKAHSVHIILIFIERLVIWLENRGRLSRISLPYYSKRRPIDGGLSDGSGSVQGESGKGG